MAATAMIDRLIHHAEILPLKGDSYRLRGKEDARPQRPALGHHELSAAARSRRAVRVTDEAKSRTRDS